MQNTISIHVGNTSSIVHNNRLTNEHTNQDIDSTRSHENIVIKQENIKDSYEKLFGEAVDSFNAKQRRSDRKINNYLQKVKDSTLDHQKEFIMQIGDYQSLEEEAEYENCEVWETKEWKLRAETLKRAVSEFQENNPNLYVYNAVIHLDELNPHAHVNFIPVGDGMNKGMSRQVSMNRALENMGYDAKFVVSEEAKNVRERGRVKLDNSTNFKNWRDDNLERVKEIAKEVYKEAGHEFEFTEGDKSKDHLSVEAYKKAVESAKDKSKEIISEARIEAETKRREALEGFYEAWEESWDDTRKEFPDFKMRGDTPQAMELIESGTMGFHDILPYIERGTPREWGFSAKEVAQLFKEKIRQVHEYISLQAHKMASKVSELIQKVKDLRETKEVLEDDISSYSDTVENAMETLESLNEERIEKEAQINAIQELSDSIDELRGHVKDDEPDIKIKQGVFSSEPTVTMPYSKYEKLKIANWNNGFEDSLKNFREEIGETLGKYRLYAHKAEQETERYKSKYDKANSDYVNMVGQKNKKEQVVTALREVAGFLPDGEWDKAINKREMQKAQEREMPSFDFDNDRGMSGPSL
ncbi:MAG: plasmid recombination protein [Lactococcus garvieae]